ncbi:MAG: Peroxide operon regulator [Opitutia bacterium UBA7350]|nr:MAG: Peroxide operon regulator [Opitutae bacterium UBA7350]
MQLNAEYKNLLKNALARSGLRATKQREQIFTVLLDKRDHPTADEIYARARGEMPSISLATVYNCLETLTESGLIRAVNFEREPTRYCPNLTQHAHFYCKATGEVIDIDLKDSLLAELKAALPEGYCAEQIDIAFNGQRR